MSQYTYEKCLENAYRVNWRVEDVVDGRAFDPGRAWLPAGLSGAPGLAGFDARERRLLTQVEMAAYAHLFGYVEEFIAPTVVELAADAEAEDRDAFDALTQFASEEVKHMVLFRQVRDRIDATLGFSPERVGGARETARFVRAKSRGAVLLFTACLEWVTQRHYQECFAVDGDDVDAFTRHIFKCHWQEECQHAQLDHLETLRVFATLGVAERQQAIDELIELFGAVDGLLGDQAALDVANFERALGRRLGAGESTRVLESVTRAKRHTFLVSGVTHPRFEALLAEVTTPAQRHRLDAALRELLPVLAAA